MNIAVVVNCLKIGGMERVAINLSDAFYNSHHDISLIYLKDRKRDIEPDNSEVAVYSFKLKNKVLKTGYGLIFYLVSKILNILFKKTFPIWFSYLEAKSFKKQLEELESIKGRFDIIIFRGQGTFEHIWPINDSRYVFVCENIQKKNMYGFLSRWIFSKLFHNRNVVCVSEGALNSFDDLTKTYNIIPKKKLVINNPNDVCKIQRDAYLSDSALHDKPYILGLGRLVPQKNFSLLLKAYDMAVKKFNIQQDLVIVGDGRERLLLEKEALNLGIADRVFFKGPKSNPFPWFRQADLFVLSSSFEGLGMVLVESLACGTKVVSTDSKGGVRQIMNGPLEAFLSKEEPEMLSEIIHFALNQNWNKSFDDYVKSLLKEFNGDSIVRQYISEFGEK